MASRDELVDFVQFISYFGGEINLTFVEPTGVRHVSKEDAEILVDAYLDRQQPEGD